jgi:hypothetical protein
MTNDLVSTMMNTALAPSQGLVNQDFELVRRNLIDRISDINNTIAEVNQLATQSQSPRFYEILSHLYKTASEVNETLLDVQKKIADLNKQEGNKPAQNITHNNLIMTTEELRRLILNDNSASNT